MVVAEHEIHRVAIVDDNLADADVMGELVREAGYEPVVLPPPFGDVHSLVKVVRKRANAAICDHRLRGLAHFSGAEAVAELVGVNIPAVLVTQYVDIDADVSIRRWRNHIPVLLSRDEADSDQIAKGLDDCAREINGQYLPGRRSWRTLIQVDGTSDESGEKVVEARVPSWNPHKVIRFPMTLVPPELRDRIVEDAYLFAMVNIGAERAEDLYFSDFEVAPNPAPEESLG